MKTENVKMMLGVETPDFALLPTLIISTEIHEFSLALNEKRLNSNTNKLKAQRLCQLCLNSEHGKFRELAKFGWQLYPRFCGLPSSSLHL